MRGVTVVDKINEHPALISTRTPHAGSDGAIEPRQCDKVISTRTPHAGSDRYGKFRYLYVKEFQPHAGSDTADLQDPAKQAISTRTPHAGSDRASLTSR